MSRDIPVELSDRIIARAIKVKQNYTKRYITLTFSAPEDMPIPGEIDPNDWAIKTLSKRKLRLYPILDGYIFYHGQSIPVFSHPEEGKICDSTYYPNLIEL